MGEESPPEQAIQRAWDRSSRSKRLASASSIREVIMNTSRRSFMASSATLAAGAALGISPRKSSRTYGPVKLYTHFIFFKEPIEIASELFVDEANDLFGIRCFDEKGIRRAVIQTSFLNLKAVLRDG